MVLEEELCRCIECFWLLLCRPFVLPDVHLCYLFEVLWWAHTLVLHVFLGVVFILLNS